MARITVLPDTLCNQIAAGEVVERPAAVVKELLENSIDAGSRKVTVSLLEGGRKEIRVVDNGIGMSRDDAILSLERHATSKIRTVEDLQHIRSLGFRGEALPSIASVSRFEMVTREHDAVSGTLVRVEGGVLKDARETGCPPGTMIAVRDLFFNIPARRKFLRSVETEMSHIGDQFLRTALAHPGIHLQLVHQERVQYDFPQVKSEEQRAAQVLGGDLATKLRPFSLETPNVKVRGLASMPDLQRTTGHSMFVYVNGRPVWDRVLNRAISSAYDTLLQRGRFPVVVLFVELDSDMVDVNVHPTKREIRFRAPGEVIDAVSRAIGSAVKVAAPVQTASRKGPDPWRNLPDVGSFKYDNPFKGSPPPSPMARDEQRPMESPPGRLRDMDRVRAPMPVQRRVFEPSPPPIAPVGPVEEGAAPDEPEGFFSRLRLIGQLANSYILLEDADGLILVDQHAAHERILFDRLTAEGQKEPVQRLLRPAVLNLAPREAVTLGGWIEQLREIGFEIESFGGESFVIHSIPAALGGHSPEEIVRDLLGLALEEENRPKSDFLASIAKTAACHAAVRAGERLAPEEIRRLLRDLDRTSVSATCPHGRPLWFRITNDEIAKSFHRT
ncbi:MAG: DNA mismatch repair endonuclease MutL [Acidobacteriota bacterium]